MSSTLTDERASTAYWPDTRPALRGNDPHEGGDGL